MRQVLAVCMTLVFVLGLVGAALAQGTQPVLGQRPGPRPPAPARRLDDGHHEVDRAQCRAQDRHEQAGRDEDRQERRRQARGQGRSGGPRGQHKMMGEVTKIDSSKGMVTLKTDEGDLDLHFPPSALQGIKEGDRVEVQLAIRPASAAGAGSKPAAGKAPATKTDDVTKGSGKAPASTGAPQQPKTQ